MNDPQYYQAIVSQRVVVATSDPSEVELLIRRHLPGRTIVGISPDKGRFEVHGTADLEIKDIKSSSLEEAGRHLARSHEIERQLKLIRGGQKK